MGSMSIDMTMSMRTNSRRGSYSTPHHGHLHSLRNDTPMLTSNAAFHHHHYPHTSPFDETLEEDERMVEDLLLPPPNSACSSISSSFHEAGATFSSSNTTSSFTTSDPFYLQASQQAFAPNPATTQGLFAQNGRITQGSQFALQTAF